MRQCLYLHKGKVAKEETSTNEKEGPDQTSYNVVQTKLGVWHATDAGHEWCKRAHDWHKACKHDSLPSILCVELLCRQHMLQTNKYVG